MHLCAELIAASMMLEPLGEVGAIFSLQLSSRAQFTKINNKKVIVENQCEKHKKSSLLSWATKPDVFFCEKRKKNKHSFIKNNMPNKNATTLHHIQLHGAKRKK